MFQKLLLSGTKISFLQEFECVSNWPYSLNFICFGGGSRKKWNEILDCRDVNALINAKFFLLILDMNLF